MGFFSWHTQDTGRSIANSYSSRIPFTVYMYDDKGNKFREDDYEGYGVFGGKDFYVLLAEMNGLNGDTEDLLRQEGISLAFSDKPCKHPNLAESSVWKWRDEKPKLCELQGFFYG